MTNSKITGTGMIPTYPRESLLTPLGRPEIGRPPQIIYAVPCRIWDTARVPIIGNIPVFTIIIPIRSPITVEISKVIIIAATGGIPHFTIIYDAKIPTKETTEPIDKSIPPASITNINPTVIIPVIETCLNTVNKFPAVKKEAGYNPPKMIISKIRTAITEYYFIKSSTCFITDLLLIF